MARKGILLATVMLLFCSAGLARAAEGELGVALDLTYVSSYIWRGFDVYGPGGHSAIQPSIDIDLYGTGFGLNVWSSRAVSSGYENAEELDITLSYGSSLFEGETYAADYTIGWVYYNYPDGPTKDWDMQEFFAEISLPDICPAGIVPSYTIICMWPSVSDSPNVSNNGGWLHIFGLGYDLSIPGIIEGTTEQVLNLSANAVYNDGTGGANVDHDWSHLVFGASTAFDLTKNLVFTPGIYYQASMDDSVNDDDETWCSLSMTYTF